MLALCYILIRIEVTLKREKLFSCNWKKKTGLALLEHVAAVAPRRLLVLAAARDRAVAGNAEADGLLIGGKARVASSLAMAACRARLLGPYSDARRW